MCVSVCVCMSVRVFVSVSVSVCVSVCLCVRAAHLTMLALPATITYPLYKVMHHALLSSQDCDGQRTIIVTSLLSDQLCWLTEACEILLLWRRNPQCGDLVVVRRMRRQDKPRLS